MEVTQSGKPVIEIIKWVKFNAPSVKDEVLQLAAASSSKMSFAVELQKKYGLDQNASIIVASQFFKK